MKRILMIIALICTTTISFAEVNNYQFGTTVNAVDGSFPYKLYPTTNMWIFLKLDTRDGKIWMVQYTVENSSNRMEMPLSTDLLPQTVLEEDRVPGRFELYPTSNIYNFIMLDRKYGYTYQVQWSIEADKRGVVSIPSY